MKQSIRAKRMARHHSRLKKVPTLNLVSLMDIFTILVFFLLVNQGAETQMPSNESIKLPQSTSDKLPEDALIVMVSKDDIIVQGRPVMKASEAEQSKDDLLKPLTAELQLQKQNRIVSSNEEKNPAIIMGDKDIPYHLLKKIMFTLADAQYTDISLAVLKKE